jgi:FAD/FMN-containing dehydrogenase
MCAMPGTSFLIEDVACPVDKLADMTNDLVEMFEKYGYKDASCFGHALEGNLHLVFSQVRIFVGQMCWPEAHILTCPASHCMLASLP